MELVGLIKTASLKTELSVFKNREGPYQPAHLYTKQHHTKRSSMCLKTEKAHTSLLICTGYESIHCLHTESLSPV